jgi:hypothetical protein
VSLNTWQFYQYLEHPDKMGVHDEVQLRGLLKEYPYFQTGHILLAKCLKNMESYTFDKQLKVAALYAPNRSSLYTILKNTKSTPYSPPMPHTPEENIEKEVAVEEVIPVLTEAFVAEEEQVKMEGPIPQESIIVEAEMPLPIAEAPIIVEPKAAEDSKPEAKEIEVKANSFTLKAVDSAKLEDRRMEIERIYNEYMRNKAKALDEETIPVKVDPIEAHIAEPVLINELALPEATEEASEQEVVKSFNEETIIAPFVIETPAMNSPVAVEEEIDEEVTTPSNSPTYSFTTWLKLKNYAEIKEEPAALDIKPVKEVEMKVSVEDIKPIADTNDILERFMQLNPTISRPKAEFYSPEKAAKKSLEEDDEIATETLARINLKQGNYLKAIRIYEKLSLKYPDKSHIFAAQILQIKTDNNIH